MAITGNTIKEVKKLKDYCDNTPCEECIFNNCADNNFADKSCFFKCFPFQYDIKEITQKFFDNAVVQ